MADDKTRSKTFTVDGEQGEMPSVTRLLNRKSMKKEPPGPPGMAPPSPPGAPRMPGAAPPPPFPGKPPGPPPTSAAPPSFEPSPPSFGEAVPADAPATAEPPAYGEVSAGEASGISISFENPAATLEPSPSAAAAP